MAVYNRMYDRINKTNLACFYISDGIDDDDNSLAHSSVVQGSILHCYKYVKQDSSDTASNTVKFYCSLKDLENGSTYRFVASKTTGDNPHIFILSSTGEIIKTSSSTTLLQFTKDATMDRLLVTVEPTQTTKISTSLCKGMTSTSVPYYQKISNVKGTNLVNAKTNKVISGESEASFIVSIQNQIPQIVYSKTLPVWGVTLNSNGYPSTFGSTSYTKLWGRTSNYDMYWFVPTSESTVKNILNISTALRKIMIPEGVNWEYSDIFRNLVSDGEIYVPEDSPVLRNSSFYKKFIGWTLYIYDTSIGDVVSKKVITESTSYAS